MNKIGLTKISDNNFDITPCEIKFHGFSVTLGNGIKRAFSGSDIKLEFSHPCNKYIEQFFIPEMQSVFQFPEDPLFTIQFIQNVNNFISQCIHLGHLHEYYASNGMSFNPEADAQVNNISTQQIEPYLNKINVIGQSNLSQEIKLKLFSIVHSTTLTFIDDLLRFSNQRKSSTDDITFKIKAQLLPLDFAPGGRLTPGGQLHPGGLLNSQSNNSWRNVFVCLFAIVVGYIFYVYDLKQVILNTISRI